MLRMKLRLNHACLIWLALAMPVMAQESESGKSAAKEDAPAVKEDAPAVKKDAPAATDSALAATDAEPTAVVTDVIDPAFDRYVDLALLAPAVEQEDAGILTDLALQAAFGESVLERSHKAVTSSELASLALKVALESKDDKSLDRLVKLAEKSGNKDLKTQIEMQRKLTSASRAVPAAMVSLDQMSVEGLKDFKDYSADIKLALRLGDRWKLEEIKGADLSALPEELQKQIAEAIAAADEKLSQDSDALTKLLGVSRECNRHKPPTTPPGYRPPGYGPPTTPPGYGPPTTPPGYGPPTTPPGYGPPTTPPGYGPPTTPPGYGPPTTPPGGGYKIGRAHV